MNKQHKKLIKLQLLESDRTPIKIIDVPVETFYTDVLGVWIDGKLRVFVPNPDYGVLPTPTASEQTFLVVGEDPLKDNIVVYGNPGGEGDPNA